MSRQFDKNMNRKALVVEIHARLQEYGLRGPISILYNTESI
jgi:hypothetical protein